MPLDVSKEVIAIIAEVSGFDEEDISPDSNMIEELDIDSIKAIEITVALEKKFNISIRDEDVPNITMVRDAIATVKKIFQATHHVS